MDTEKLSAQSRAEKIALRFWAKVQKAPDCWLWTGSRNPDGYGLFGLEGIAQRAHRVSWNLSGNLIPTGKFVLHKCDNPPCVNPDHLFVGDNAENMRDMYRKKRREPTAGRTPKPYCMRGHFKSPENLYGKNQCKACTKIHQANRTLRNQQGRITNV